MSIFLGKNKGNFAIAKLQSYLHTDYLTIIKITHPFTNNTISLIINTIDQLCKFAIAKLVYIFLKIYLSLPTQQQGSGKLLLRKQTLSHLSFAKFVQIKCRGNEKKQALANSSKFAKFIFRHTLCLLQLRRVRKHRKLRKYRKSQFPPISKKLFLWKKSLHYATLIIYHQQCKKHTNGYTNITQACKNTHLRGIHRCFRF